MRNDRSVVQVESRMDVDEGGLLLHFGDVVVCQAVRDLCTHKYYSSPDLLRIANYTIRHTVSTKHTHIV